MAFLLVHAAQSELRNAGLISSPAKLGRWLKAGGVKRSRSKPI